MRRKTAGFYSLKRPKLRASWNKINLYNLSRFASPVRTADTLYKQKWVSKGASRKYHGETLAEKHWTRLFRPRVHAVVPMKPLSLAQNDGRQQSAGRGSGLEKVIRPQDKLKVDKSRIPYANMVYAALERRLDMAVHRALFASSTRQARQFCIHGFVKVNGQKMVYPGYMLNPGDMFQVDPERVMFATGAGKDGAQRRQGRVRRRLAAKGITVLGKPKEAAEGGAEEVAAPAAAEESMLDSRTTLQQLLDTSKVIASNETHASAKRKRALRDFTRLVRKTLSQTPRKSVDGPGVPAANATAQLTELMSTLNIRLDTTPTPSRNRSSRGDAAPAASSESSETSQPESYAPQPAVPLAETQTVRTHQRNQLAAALAEARDNPIDATKPYATPWRPRPFMSAFAFVPRYLEVHHAICAAVYLRHPAARPGLAEVPTPFDNEMLALAHNWYLRRR